MNEPNESNIAPDAPEQKERLTRYANAMHAMEHKLMDAAKALREADKELKSAYFVESTRADAGKMDKLSRDLLETLATAGVLVTHVHQHLKDISQTTRADLLTVMEQYPEGDAILGQIADECDAKNAKGPKLVPPTGPALN